MTTLIWVDYVILGIVGLSALISIVRGFVREALSLLGWIGAIWVALTFCKPLSVMLSELVSVPSVRVAGAFIALFVASLLVAAVINYLAGKLVEKTGLSGTDRMLGIIFGTVRGMIVVSVLVLLAGFTALPQDPWWEQAVLIKHFQAMAVEIRGFLPADIASSIQY